jgi:hypothetical protein
MRLSVSDLQCWQRYRNSEEVTLAECLTQLRREEPPSPALLAGRKLHKALEAARCDEAVVEPAPFGQTHLKYKDYVFFFQCDVELSIPDVRELRGEMLVNTVLGPVVLVGVVDSIGSVVSDYKLTGHFDPERLIASYQWRCYLQMFEQHRFDYKVFVGEEIKPKEWAIKDYHEISVYRYPGMEQDIEGEIGECVKFMREYVWSTVNSSGGLAGGNKG